MTAVSPFTIRMGSLLGRMPLAGSVSRLSVGLCAGKCSLPPLGESVCLSLARGYVMALALMIVAFSGFTAATIQAQDSQAVAAHTTTHVFVDWPNVGLTTAEIGALWADGVTTQRLVRRYGQRFREADPIARPFVSRGWSGQIVGGSLALVADIGIRYILHRRNHHRWERWAPTVLIAYGTIGSVHNARSLTR